MVKDLTDAEISERVAILKRFRTLLEQQRNKFREYLKVLELQQGKIEADDGAAMTAHAELENQIVANLSCLQKVIDPMQKMYTAVTGSQGDENIQEIQAELSDLQQKVLAQNDKNRATLKIHIAQIRNQLDDARAKNPYRGRISVYAEKSAAPGNMITISA